MFGWRLVPEDIFRHLQDRVRELEKQNEGLIDRLLIDRGQLPIGEETKATLSAMESVRDAFYSELSALETGEDVRHTDSGETEEDV